MSIALRNWLLLFLGLSYIAVLVLSTAHLTKWFALTAGDLPSWLSLALALGWEFLAFSLSLASTLEPRLRFTFYAAIFVLLTVWFGVFIAMTYAAPTLPLWLVAVQSSFALGPLIAGRAIGELLRMEIRQPGRPEAQPVTASPPVTTLPAMRVSPPPGTVAPAPVAQAAQVVRVETHVHPVMPNREEVRQSRLLDAAESRLLEFIEEGTNDLSELLKRLGWKEPMLAATVARLEARGLIRSNGVGWEIAR